MIRPTREDSIIRQRMIDIVLSIRPLPETIRPADELVQEARNILVDSGPPKGSLTAHRRERTLARLEEFARKKRAA